MNIARGALIRGAALFAGMLAVFFALSVVRARIRAAAAAAVIETNEGYFRGGTDMGSVEVTKAVSGAAAGIAEMILTAVLWILAVLFLWNGCYAVFKYVKSREIIYEKRHF